MAKILLAVLLLLSGLVGSRALAQESESLEFSGLAITPFLIEAELEGGEVSEQKILLTNTTGKKVSYDISINDFIPDEESGQAKFLPTGQDAQAQYSLSSWISITGQPNFSLNPGESSEIKFQITPPKDAEPGTHYGGMLFSVRTSETTVAGSAVVEKVGAIILAKIGRAKEQGNISNMYVDDSATGGKNLILQFHNFGNVHLKPKGEIFIHNIFGGQSGNLYVNRDAEIILPETQKEFVSNWKPGVFTFGRYTATAVLYYGNPKIEVRNTISFWILPIKQLMAFLILVFAMVFFGRKGIRRYNKWLIRKAKR